MKKMDLVGWSKHTAQRLILAFQGGYSSHVFSSKLDLPYLVLVGTHHKTGTAWLMNIFERIAIHFRLNYFYGLQEDLPPDTEIFFQHHSLFDIPDLPRTFRGIHMIRDPRDVIISGCMYHQKSEESWLHLYQMEYDGLTYQKKINSLATLEDKIFFEMDHAGKRTIEDMLSWNYNQPHFFEIKYEDLIEDRELFIFHKMFSFLGFPGRTIPTMLAVAYQNSLFSGKLNKSLHIRSGNQGQWRDYFSPAHKARFIDLFGDALIQLGYEVDHAWAEEA